VLANENDAYEIEHPYVYDSDMGFGVKKVVTRVIVKKS